MRAGRRAERDFVVAFLLGLLIGFLGGVGYVRGAEPLTTREARTVFLKAEPHGHFHGCARRSASTLVCRVDVREVATHEWQDPTTGEWVVEGRIVYWVPARVPIRLGGVDWQAARPAY